VYIANTVSMLTNVHHNTPQEIDIPQKISAAGFKLPDCVHTLRIAIMIILHRDGAGSLGSENILRHDPRIISSALIKKNSIKEIYECYPLFDQRKNMYVVLFISLYVVLSSIKEN
jgi:hypothetical protein